MNIETKNELDYSDEVEALLNEKRASLLEDRTHTSWVDLFNANLFNFEKIVAYYERNSRKAKKDGECAAMEIKKILLSEKHILSLNDMKNTYVMKLLSDARLSYQAKKSANTSARNKKNVSTRYSKDKSIQSVENSNSESFEEKAIEVKQKIELLTSNNDWHDSTWLDDEPADWGVFHLPTLRRPKGLEWNDYWENVWRWLYKLADSEYKMNDYDKGNFAGFKKAMGEDFGQLWLDLNKIRRATKDEYKLNPVGVGKV